MIPKCNVSHIRYIAVVTSPKGTIGIMLTFFFFTCMCAWFATMLGNDFPPSEIVPDESYARDYYAAAIKLDLYWDTTIPYKVLFKVILEQCWITISVPIH